MSDNVDNFYISQPRKFKSPPANFLYERPQCKYIVISRQPKIQQLHYTSRQPKQLQSYVQYTRQNYTVPHPESGQYYTNRKHQGQNLRYGTPDNLYNSHPNQINGEPFSMHYTQTNINPGQFQGRNDYTNMESNSDHFHCQYRPGDSNFQHPVKGHSLSKTQHETRQSSTRQPAQSDLKLKFKQRKFTSFCACVVD